MGFGPLRGVTPQYHNTKFALQLPLDFFFPSINHFQVNRAENTCKYLQQLTSGLSELLCRVTKLVTVVAFKWLFSNTNVLEKENIL